MFEKKGTEREPRLQAKSNRTIVKHASVGILLTRYQTKLYTRHGGETVSPSSFGDPRARIFPGYRVSLKQEEEKLVN